MLKENITLIICIGPAQYMLEKYIVNIVPKKSNTYIRTTANHSKINFKYIHTSTIPKSICFQKLISTNPLLGVADSLR